MAGTKTCHHGTAAESRLIKLSKEGKDVSKITIIDNALQIYISCVACRENEAVIFQAEGEFCLDCWQEMTHPKV